MNWFRNRQASAHAQAQPESARSIPDLVLIEQTIADERAIEPAVAIEPFREAEYPTDDDITAAFTELTAPQPIPPKVPKPPIPTQIKTFVGRRPWIFLPLLGVFPAIALTLDRLHPPQVSAPVANRVPIATAATTPATNSTLPTQTPIPKQSPIALTPALTPVDLTKLTPEQKAMNARAKAMFEATNAPVDAYVEMHVAIAKGRAIAFASNTAINVTDTQGKKLATLAASDVHTAQSSGGGVAIGGTTAAAVLVEPEPGGLLYVNNRPYRGKLLLAFDGGQVHGINYINLRHYLYSVVASEVSPSWSTEAIKAQAVAARSYALTYYFKPAGKTLFHLGSDEYYQVYSGTQKEDDRSNQAVDLTAGEYVSYKGGIVESLYAASDDIVAEAFAGKGMSQLGAKSLAEQGYKYDQILANYYPTTKVGKIAKEE